VKRFKEEANPKKSWCGEKGGEKEKAKGKEEEEKRKGGGERRREKEGRARGGKFKRKGEDLQRN